MSGFVGNALPLGQSRAGWSARSVNRARQGRVMVARMGMEEPGRNRDRIWSGLLGGAAALLGGVVGGIAAGGIPRLPPVESALAGTPYKNKGIGDKLAQVPVFLVTNASGQPYLANMEESHQVGLIFFSPEDAAKMLEHMKMNAGAEDARVYVMSLDKAMEMVKAKPTPSGIKSQGGQDLMMVFRLYPDTNQVKNAGVVLGRRNAASSQVPLFVVKGLTIRKGRDRVQPLFFSKEDLETNWDRLCAKDPKLPRRPNIEVYSLQNILERMEEGDESEALREWGFFPSSRSVDFMQEQKGQKSGKAKMHINPLLSD